MNKNMTFFKTFLAALLAFVVANIVLGILGLMMFAGLVAMMGGVGDGVTHIEQGTVLKIDLADGISDSPVSSPINSVGFSGVEFDRSNTIMQAVDAIDRAAEDDRITGIYINISSMNISMANTEELRAAIERFRQQSGKFVVSYSDMYSQTSYYFSSAADRVYLNPQGDVLWKGLGAHVMFYKGLLDKLGIEPEILRHGTFKSAVEPFMLDRMSPENRLQLTTYANTIWGTLLHDISASRGIDSAVLSNYATELSLRSASHALEYGFVDALMYEDQVMSVLGRLSSGIETAEQAESSVLDEGQNVAVSVVTADEAPVESAGGEDNEKADPANAPEEKAPVKSKEKQKDPKFVTLSDYISSARYSNYESRSYNKKIAVIYADGEIIDGESTGRAIGGNTIAAKIAKARKDDNVKAIVLRVNSPGGSALASEVMWREMDKTRQVKPVIVSMGDMAASGGYYISCPADVIISNKTTLTGSIGVFGLLFNMGNTLKDKLGITVDVAKTNPSADLGSPYRKMTSHERDVLMYSVEQVYDTFVGHVADGRNLTASYVDEIGQGRIWSGVSAIEIGLVDGFGGIKEAIELAADRAGIPDDYMVWEVVDMPDNLSVILRTLMAGEQVKMHDRLGEAFVHYNSVMGILSQEGKVQARMPYVLDIR